MPRPPESRAKTGSEPRCHSSGSGREIKSERYENNGIVSGLLCDTALDKEGETMSLDAIKQVTQAEEASRARKAEAAQNAKKAVAEAEREGQAQLDAARAQAESKVWAMMSDAEAEAARQAEAIQAQTARDCQALKDAAEARLEAAADLIVGKVVNLT